MLDYYHAAADRGDLHAHVALGHLYLLAPSGTVRADVAKASEHLHAAAEANETLSMTVLGLLYAHGLGVPRDAVLAREFLAQPVAAGVAAAISTLGTLQLRGAGEPDGLPAPAAAFASFAAAGTAGSPDGHFNAGMMHLDGSAPTGRNFQAAAASLLLAANAGHVQAQHRLGSMYLHGIGSKWRARARATARTGAVCVRVRVRARELIDDTTLGCLTPGGCARAERC